MVIILFNIYFFNIINLQQQLNLKINNDLYLYL